MKACCQDPENREEPERLAPDLVVETCRVCGSKHYKLTADIGDAVSEGVEV